MRIRVLAFATAAEALGSDRAEIELAEGGSLADLKRALALRSPALAARLETLALAVDGEIARETRPLVDGDEVALLPPVSGG
jgi:molybdopterin converting factor subunit 1